MSRQQHKNLTSLSADIRQAGFNLTLILSQFKQRLELAGLLDSRGKADYETVVANWDALWQEEEDHGK